ncbi:MAG: ABC transporter substrate-binding protein [Streptomycetaceae bacterium]|nr:ABC transporter substrate-binding protein [Streptomycetaceae bacterium]
MRPYRTFAALAAAALLATGCSGRDGTTGREEGASAATASPVGGDFGTLQGVCRPGTAEGAPAQGVGDDGIKVGVLSDVGFTKNPEFLDAAMVFTSWCNDAGGVDGRKLVADIHDTRMVEVRQRMIEACRDDFALVGGSAALDGTGTKERLSCLLPEFPAQTVLQENDGADLQVYPHHGGPSYNRFAGYDNWLLKEAYPGSAGSLGLIIGDSPSTKVNGAKAEEGLKAAGGTVVYSDAYPAQGVSDWTPYAQAIKNKGVKGLVYLGSFAQLAKLEQSLTTIGYKPDWIDANSNAYTPDFIQLAGGQVLDAQNNLADLSGIYPVEAAADNPATRQLLDLYAKYAPGAKVTLPAVRAFSSWLLFAKAAAACGNDLTRKCAYDAARKESAWTGGGLQAPKDLSRSDLPATCFNVEKATPEGWRPADFKPDRGAFRCDAPAWKLTGSYARPLTLADVGKSPADFR